MANQAPQRQALVLSCEVPGEDPLPGARYNAEKLSKFFRRANVPTGCVYGRKLTLDRAKEDINDFFSIHCDVHVLYGIFHGRQGSWKLSDGTTLGLAEILEQWDFAKELGTAQHLLIVSDSCESGNMVNEAALLGREDIAVQASCARGSTSPDVVGETFTEYLLWNLQGRSTANKRGSDMLIHIERALLRFGPCYYCPDPSNFRGWVFINEDGADPSSSHSVSLASDTSDTTSQISGPEELFDPRSPTPEPEDATAPENATAPEPADTIVPDRSHSALLMSLKFFDGDHGLIGLIRSVDWEHPMTGAPHTLDLVKHWIRDFFSHSSLLHVLCGIFRGHAGSWKLPDGRLLGLHDILEQWDLAKDEGTARHLLIVSDSCESGHMVNEVALLGREDVAVQASCARGSNSPDVVGVTFTEYLQWNLTGRSIANERGRDMVIRERALLALRPSYYCPARTNYRGMVFINEDGADLRGRSLHYPDFSWFIPDGADFFWFMSVIPTAELILCSTLIPPLLPLIGLGLFLKCTIGID